MIVIVKVILVDGCTGVKMIMVDVSGGSDNIKHLYLVQGFQCIDEAVICNLYLTCQYTLSLVICRATARNCTACWPSMTRCWTSSVLAVLWMEVRAVATLLLSPVCLVQFFSYPLLSVCTLLWAEHACNYQDMNWTLQIINLDVVDVKHEGHAANVLILSG